MRRNDFGNRGKGSHPGLADLGGYWHWIQRGVNFERNGLVVEIEGMLIGADAGVGMLGGVVIVQGDFGIVVGGHVGSDEDTLQRRPY